MAQPSALKYINLTVRHGCLEQWKGLSVSHYLQWFIVVERLYFHTWCDRIASALLFQQEGRNFGPVLLDFFGAHARHPIVRAIGIAPFASFSFYFVFFFFTMTSSLLRVLNVQSSHTSAFKCLRYAKKALFPRYRPFNWLASDTKCCNKFSLFSFDSTKTNTTTTIGSFTRFTKVWC